MSHFVRTVFLAIFICQSLSPGVTFSGDSVMAGVQNAETVKPYKGMLLAANSSVTRKSSVKQVVKTCVPECRSGYVCIDGLCVENCNPPCPKNYYCTGKGECLPMVKTSTQFNDESEKAEQPKSISSVKKNENCIPECRHGYTCIGGKCVENCNPPCPNGYYCASGGTCLPLGQEEDRIVVRTDRDKELYETGHVGQIIFGTVIELVGLVMIAGGASSAYASERSYGYQTDQGLIVSVVGIPVLTLGVILQIRGIVKQSKHRKWLEQQSK
jgi:hypothetical protein